jgi:hypothetical protein
VEQQILFENDRKKSKGKSGFFAALRMTNSRGCWNDRKKSKGKSGFFPFVALRVRMTKS